MPEENNGGGEGKVLTESTVILTLDRPTFKMSIGGHTENFDEALCMARMAVDYFESKLRTERAGALLNLGGRMPLDLPPRGPRR